MSARPARGRRAGAGRGTSSGAIVAPTYRGTLGCGEGNPAQPPGFGDRFPGSGERHSGMTIGTRLFTWWKGELVGTDQFGNRYYREKPGRRLRAGGGRESRERRWVLYKGTSEA